MQNCVRHELQLKSLTCSGVGTVNLNAGMCVRDCCRTGACREQPPRGAPWVSGLVGHFVQTWPDSECSHTVQCLDCSDLNWRCNHYTVLARYGPFGVDVPLNFDNTHSLTHSVFSLLFHCEEELLGAEIPLNIHQSRSSMSLLIPRVKICGMWSKW